MNEPTVDDFLARARAASDDGERAAAIEDAWRLADRGTAYPSSDWRSILGALVDSGAAADRIRTCIDRVVAAAAVDIDTWGFTESIVALVRIGAEPDALAILASARAILEERSTRSYEWGLLAQGISHVEAFLPQVRALLARGAEVAAGRGDFDNLAGLAGHLQMIGKDPSGALALQRRAEELWRAKEGRELREVWPVANGWQALGCLDERDRLLAEVGRAAASVDDFLMLALIWRSHGDPRGVGAVTAAAERAQSAADWYHVAERAYECDADREVISHA